MQTFCGGCNGVAALRCAGSLARAGLIKFHWECWSECNLRCSFCYRSRGNPLSTPEAELLIRTAATGGLESVTFAGGDPLLRDDLLHLCRLTREFGLGVEIQTNAHAMRRTSWEALLTSQRVCLSLDGPDAATHDRMRGRLHNYDRVLALLGRLDRAGIPVSVRTLVSLANYSAVPDVGPILARFGNVMTWTLLEFTAVNEGWANRSLYLLPSAEFELTVVEAELRYLGDAKVDVFRTAEKVGAYMMISPDGMVYGTTDEALSRSGQHRYAGRLLDQHLADVVSKLPFDAARHRSRYGWESEGLRGPGLRP